MRDIERAIRDRRSPEVEHPLEGVPSANKSADITKSSAASDMETAISEHSERSVQVDTPDQNQSACNSVEKGDDASRHTSSIAGPLESADSESAAESNESNMAISLPLQALAEAGFLTPDRPKDRLSEQFRRIKRPLLKNLSSQQSVETHSNIIMVTSAVSGEGKTYTAINLAMSLALEHERTVVLIDADVLKGTASALLGIDPQTPGLTDLLDDRLSSLDASLFETNVPGLILVPAGKRSENATELLASGKMRELINELALRHQDRIVVLDCSPILQTNEANVLIDYAGQVVFVVASEATSQGLVTEALSHFDDNKTVGILLNKASTSGTTYDYNYGYR